MKPNERAELVLAGDVGGTKTNLGLFSRGKTRPVPRIVETFASKEASNLETLLGRFLQQHPHPVSSVCLGIAGPVVDGRCRATNLPWQVSEARLRRRFQWPRMSLINDLSATAIAIPLLREGELVRLNKGRKKRDGNVALLAPGTGLGMALLMCRKGRFLPLPSEGGHVDFAPTCDREIELWRYARRRFGHVSPERLLSGPGLYQIYSWLRDSGRFKEPLWLREALSRGDPGKVITENAFREKSRLCVETVNIYVSMLGATAGNLALMGMATGGVYLGGGISPKILPALSQGAFMEAFMDKGRFSNLMKEIPVQVVLNEEAALLGAAVCAFELSE